MSPVAELRLDTHALEALLAESFPQLYDGGRSFTVEAVGPMTARLRLHVSERHLRPGGTISGPSIFALADVALYVAIMAQIGPVTLAVTTNITLNFLRKPPPVDLIGCCRLLKLGRRLAMGEVSIHTQDDDVPFAHATGTYSIPPAGKL